MYLGYIRPYSLLPTFPKLAYLPPNFMIFFTLPLSHAVQLEMSIYELVWDNLLEQGQFIMTTPQRKVTLSYPEAISCQ